MRLELPFPPPDLNPNGRSHWAKKARVAKKFKNDCLMLLNGSRTALAGRDSFSLTFCPPDRHKRDLDNMLAAMKHGLDALAAVCGVNDSEFKLTIAKGEPVKGGLVIIEAA
jgi:crossover junction endodeoxyribonuclease RusA